MLNSLTMLLIFSISCVFGVVCYVLYSNKGQGLHYGQLCQQVPLTITKILTVIKKKLNNFMVIIFSRINRFLSLINVNVIASFIWAILILLVVNYLKLIFLIVFGLILFLLLYVSFKKLSFNEMGASFIAYWSAVTAISLISVLSHYKLYFWSYVIKDVFVISYYFDSNFFNDSSYFFGCSEYSYYYTLTIAIISLFANYHTLVYMKSDQKKEKFIVFLNAFAFSMLLLVFSKNLLVILLSWELLGITSFFLINHNDTQINSVRSALKALTFNKISDILFILGLIIFFCLTHSLNVSETVLTTLITQTSSEMSMLKRLVIELFLLFIFLGASIKSVQFFSFMWLPDSMKAPVPASALIHSATLVAAGFYVIVLFKTLFFYYWGVLLFASVGLLTACLGSLVAAYQTDLKKILAYSTIANCGFMLTLLSMYDTKVFLCYFVVHGIFKSACFMYSGEVILSQHHSQDVRSYYNQFSNLKKSIVGIVPSILLLAGLPCTITYSVKHMLILEQYSEFQIYSLNTFFAFYSFLSFCYAVNYLIRVFFFNFNSKEYENAYSSTYFHTNFLLNMLYSVTSALITFFLYSSMCTYTRYMGSHYTIWYDFGLHIVFSVILLFCLGMLHFYVSMIDVQSQDADNFVNAAALYHDVIMLLLIFKTIYKIVVIALSLLLWN